MRTLLLAVLALFAALPAAPASAADLDAPRAPRVMVIGDSHIERLGPMFERAVEDTGYESLGSLARRGWSTRRYMREDDMVERLTANGTPDIVIISLGGNDRTRREETYRAQLSWVVDQAREAGAQRIVWLGPAASDMERSERAARVGQWHENNANRQAEILPALGVEWIDSRPFTQSGYGRDGIHFTLHAYRAWCHAALEAAHIEESRGETEVPPNVAISSPILAVVDLSDSHS